MFSNRKGYKIFQKPFYEYFNLYWFNLRTIESSDEKKNQEDLKNGITQGLGITNKKKINDSFPAWKWYNWFLHRFYVTIMLRTMRFFVIKNANLSLRVIRVTVKNTQQVKQFKRVMANNL